MSTRAICAATYRQRYSTPRTSESWESWSVTPSSLLHVNWRPFGRQRTVIDSSKGELQGILTYSDEQLVSVDFNHNAHSSIVDTTFTRSVDPHMHKILAWYDNEWGYSNRILDLIAYVARVRQESLARTTG